MRVKKYTASTMPEAMQVIRKELGPEAVILQSKEVRKKGVFGLFNKKNIEVIAAIDPQPIPEKEKPVNGIPKELPLEQMKKTKDKDRNQDEILTEIHDLKKMIELQAKKAGMDFPPAFKLAFNDLVDQEVDEKLAEDIIQTVIKKTENDGKQPDRKQIGVEVEAVITDKLNKYPTNGVTADKKVIQFVGPTGVGKTTTIAKVAAKLMLDDAKKVAFITTDTYRIAAIEQLKTYARILNIPVEVVYNVEDYQSALDKLVSYDYILVDTAGRNFRDRAYVKELQENMGNSDVATYLVLSLTAKPKDINDIYDQFDQIPLEAVIFTKLDETTQYGSILNISVNKEIGIAYVTNGQDVPEHIKSLSAREMSKRIAGGHYG